MIMVVAFCGSRVEFVNFFEMRKRVWTKKEKNEKMNFYKSKYWRLLFAIRIFLLKNAEELIKLQEEFL